MANVRVTNTSGRTKSRLGITLKPGKSKEVEVNSRDYFVLKAAKSFKVEKLDETNEKKTKELEIDAPLRELQDKNIEDFLAQVKEYDMDIDTAIETEQKGKNRSSLIEQLEELKEG